jgi:hypothetical protein
MEIYKQKSQKRPQILKWFKTGSPDMEKKILQIISLQVNSVGQNHEGATCPIIGLALVEEGGETRLRYIQHGMNGEPELTPDNFKVEHIAGR